MKRTPSSRLQEKPAQRMRRAFCCRSRFRWRNFGVARVRPFCGVWDECSCLCRDGHDRGLDPYGEHGLDPRSCSREGTAGFHIIPSDRRRESAQDENPAACVDEPASHGLLRRPWNSVLHICRRGSQPAIRRRLCWRQGRKRLAPIVTAGALCVNAICPGVQTGD